VTSLSVTAYDVADVVVVGSGIAGLSTALQASGARVILLTEADVGTGSASDHAQGGIAAAVATSDSPVSHAADTLTAGAHANDPGIVDLLTTAAPAAINWLAGLGARFERDGDGAYVLGREGGHGRSRIVHARGDATGREVVAVLAAAVADAPHVTTHASMRMVDLLVDRDRVVGVLARDRNNRLVAYRAGAVVMATGGSAGAWCPTTNPASSRGSGLVLAADAGAHLADLEYVQFHPTALACDADPLPLLTEALRGAGATVIDMCGRRFLHEIHAGAELAPRDVVARALWQRRAAGDQVLLDMRHVPDLDVRFPTAVALCRHHGFDPFTEPVPVTPAAHYHMGGIAVDDAGRTDVPGLFACGEVACTGAHGANRLASNSLLEALVFAQRVGRVVRSATPAGTDTVERALANVRPERLLPPSNQAVAEVRDLLMAEVGVVRTETGLRSALRRLESLVAPARGGSIAAVARMVATAALHHRATRGVHWRADVEPASAIAVRRTVITAPDRSRPVASVTEGEGERQRAGGRGTEPAERLAHATVAC
jgi:L-aspartate oxidase